MGARRRFRKTRSSAARRGRAGRRSASPARTTQVVRAVHGRVVAAVTGTTLAAAAVSVLSLEMIGAPPRMRVDSMWVHDHRAAVRTLIVALLVAVAGLIATVILRSGRLVAAAGCLAAGVVMAWRHTEAAEVVFRVLWSRYG